MQEQISEALKIEIQDKGYELPSGRISFPKKIRDKFRDEIADYYSNNITITSKMIDIYNEGCYGY